MRSTATSLLRTTPIRSQPCRNLALASASAVVRRDYTSAASTLRSFHGPARPTPLSAASTSKTQQQSCSYADWTNPSRDARRDAYNIADLEIRKPRSSSYDLAFGSQEHDNGANVDPDHMDFSNALEFTDLQSRKSSKVALPSAPRANVRMVPRTGRTVTVGANVDIARSLKVLASRVGQNKVRRDFQQQRFHERPGKKRKRLKSQRWQARFKKGFKATVSRVRELTAQGW
ncbi:hypothetical protein F5Y12DRAFT_89154 [Xylaria sp. FL1777]|nr:hypothetical protein F5Y12DRAFT_89154 [Xylaria sp. FL1777]